MAALINWLPLLLRRRKRVALMQQAPGWPLTTAMLLKSTVEAKDPLAEGGTAFQDRQVESTFYFTLEDSYYGGHLRSMPLSDGEAHRALRILPEDTPVAIRYDPANPDHNVAFPADNPAFPIAIWPT